MLKSGNEHLESLRDGRTVYIGAERVDDVTTHPAFRNAARSIAAIYDLKRADPAFSFRGRRALQRLLPEGKVEGRSRRAHAAAPRDRGA